MSIHWIIMWGAILGCYIRQTNQQCRGKSFHIWKRPCYRYGFVTGVHW